MEYLHKLYNSIDEVPAEDWNGLREGEADLFMDPRFIAAVEESMADQGRFWSLLIYDESGRPIASACLSLLQLDGALFCKGTVKRLVEYIRCVFPRYLRLRVAFCGLPVSGGQSHLRIAPGADHRQVLQLLDKVLRRIAARQRARVIVFKEFSDCESCVMDQLKELGYLRIDSLPMNCFELRFRDFGEFCTALRSHYRYKIRKSMKKFAKAGLRVESLSGAAIQSLYTDRVHQLYEAVVDRAETKLEVLPAEFFRQLARRFSDEVNLLAVMKDDQIVAFSWGILTGEVYRNLFVGVDYRLNAETDLYFNLMIHDLDHALKQNATEIHVGQTADDFKSRLGCHGRARCAYVKGATWILSWAMRATFPWVFPPAAPLPRRDLFRDASLADINGRDGG